MKTCPMSDQPWQMAALDIFYHGWGSYLVTMGYNILLRTRAGVDETKSEVISELRVNLTNKLFRFVPFLMVAFNFVAQNSNNTQAVKLVTKSRTRLHKRIGYF